MRLDDLLERVRRSTTADWNFISDPYRIYREHLVIIDAAEGQRFEQRSHTYTAALRADLSITMAWGLEDNANFQEPWANNFPDKTASSAFLDLFYNNALVFRDRYVIVDGGRAYLPIPNTREDLTVSEGDFQLIRVIHELTYRGRPFGEYLERARITVK